ncbi:MAG: magnesium/cobalt transporter CorA [Anaerolineae bacterium]|jgi:magnesium transporter|nr:magnesium/cobalt transporter CorA [Anaerolineae bacterium]
MDVMTFDADGLQPSTWEAVVEMIKTTEPEGPIYWIDVCDPHNQDMAQLQAVFGFHPLAIEDTHNQHQRPKVEEYTDHLFIITNVIAKVKPKFVFYELDIFIGGNYIVTVHEHCQPLIQAVRERLGRNHFKHHSSEYILYVIVDAMVDGYFPILTEIDEEIDELNERVLLKPTQEALTRMFELRRVLSEVWRIVEQQREMFSILTRREHDLLRHHSTLEYYLRDVYDHLLRLRDMAAMFRENLNNLTDVYMSATSNRLNIVVNRLTIITIMIGILTVISGFYGMNFERTWPPFNTEWGVNFVIFVMIALCTGVLIAFRLFRLYR